MGGSSRRRNTKGLALNADPASQARLLDLQALDSSLDRLDHRRRTLPELATIDELTARLREVDDALVDGGDARLRSCARTAQGRGRRRPGAPRARPAISSGSTPGQVSSPRELENLQSEIASLAKRRSDLEDVVLEVMERREAAQASMSSLVGRARHVDGRTRRRRRAKRDELFGAIDAEAAASSSARAAVAPDVGAELLALYEKIRATSDGVGAAALHRARCEGCHLTLNPSDLGQMRAAAPDAVLRCEECRRILVRTAESGL